MLTGQGGGLHREIPHKNRPFQLILAQQLPQLFHQLAVAPTALGRHVQADGVRNLTQLGHGRIHRHLGLTWELPLQRLIERRVHFDRGPLRATQIVFGTIGQRHRCGTKNLHGNILDQVLDKLGTIIVGTPRLVGLQHGELRGVGGIHTLVAEIPIHLENPFDTTDNAAL